MRKDTLLLAGIIGISSLGCGAEMIRPRAAGERFEDRPGRALVVGQFDVRVEGFKDENEVGLTRHRVLVGEDDVLFMDEVPPAGRTFSVWVYPGVFCFGRPTLGQSETGKVLGKGTPCAEISEKGKGYYVGTVIWRVKKRGDKVTATLDVENHRESVMAARNLVGIQTEDALVSDKLDAEKVAAKYKLP